MVRAGLTYAFVGVGMRVHGEPQTEEFPVNGSVLIHSLDIPASRKMSGLRGITSEDFMCTYCYQTFSSLVCEDCFDRTSKLLSLRISYLFSFVEYRIFNAGRSPLSQVCAPMERIWARGTGHHRARVWCELVDIRRSAWMDARARFPSGFHARGLSW